VPVIAVAPVQHFQDQGVGSSNTKRQKHSKLHIKANNSKKLKRYCPYESRIHQYDPIDETQLMDTPIFEPDEAGKWALVACPKNPPLDK